MEGGQYGAAGFGVRTGTDEDHLEEWRGGTVRSHHGGAGKGKERVEEQHRALVSTLLRQDILSADELREIESFWRNQNEWDPAGINRQVEK